MVIGRKKNRKKPLNWAPVLGLCISCGLLCYFAYQINKAFQTSQELGTILKRELVKNALIQKMGADRLPAGIVTNSLSQGLSHVMDPEAGAARSQNSPDSIKSPNELFIDEEERRRNQDLAQKILQEGRSFFENPGNEMSAKEDALNIARVLALDPERKYSKEVFEISKLILSIPMTASSEPDSTAMIENSAATEWALSMVFDLSTSPEQAMSYATDALRSQKNPTIREKIRNYFNQQYPEFAPEMEKIISREQ